jgi:splicing factor U2AF subunit
MLKYIDVSF